VRNAKAQLGPSSSSRLFRRGNGLPRACSSYLITKFLSVNSFLKKARTFFASPHASASASGRPPCLAPAEAGQAKRKSAAAAWQELAADLSEDLADRLAASWTGRWQALRHVCGIPATSWQGG
jgi:hypothetical protein